MKVQILVDNKDSWMVPYALKLKDEIIAQFGFNVSYLNDSEKVEEGDVLILLSCEKIFKRLELNVHNIVVHESALPLGKGWSPLTWQILEGKNEIPITLFEAAEAVDAGEIYEQDWIILDGTELLDEIKHKQGLATITLAKRFLGKYSEVNGTPQKGKSSFYKRRTPKDSRLDLNKTLGEQFNLLRICDNKRYPAFFIKDEVKYILKIYRDE